MCSYISWWFWAYFVYLQKHFEVIFRYVVYVKSVSEVLYTFGIHATKFGYVGRNIQHTVS